MPGTATATRPQNKTTKAAANAAKSGRTAPAEANGMSVEALVAAGLLAPTTMTERPKSTRVGGGRAKEPDPIVVKVLQLTLDGVSQFGTWTGTNRDKINVFDHAKRAFEKAQAAKGIKVKVSSQRNEDSPNKIDASKPDDQIIIDYWADPVVEEEKPEEGSEGK